MPAGKAHESLAADQCDSLAENAESIERLDQFAGVPLPQVRNADPFDHASQRRLQSHRGDKWDVSGGAAAAA